MAGFIPPVGTKGLWTLLAPFNASLLPNVSYTCIAIRNISDVIAAGGDPQALFYTPAGLSADVYEADLASDVSILTLQNPSGLVVYVPTTYLTSYPDAGGVPYKTIILAVNLGPVPESLNLSYLQSKIADSVQEIIGVKPAITPVGASATVIIPNAQDSAIVAARAAIVGTVTTDYAKYLTAQNQLNAALQKIGILENYIKRTPMLPLPPFVTITDIAPVSGGSLSLYNQAITLTAATTQGSIEVIAYSLDNGNTWSNFLITPAQSITNTWPLVLPVGTSTIKLKATDTNGAVSAIETIVVLVEATDVVWMMNTTSTGSTITLSNGPINTAITLSGTYEPSNTAVSNLAIGTTDNNGNLITSVVPMTFNTDLYFDYVLKAPNNVLINSGIMTPIGNVAVPPALPATVPVVTTVTLNSSNTEWIAPANITMITTAVGKGSDGTPTLAGTASVAFGNTFPGGAINTAASSVTFSDIYVIPGNDYPVSIPVGGSLELTYSTNVGSVIPTVISVALTSAATTWTPPTGVTNLLSVSGFGTAAVPVYTEETTSFTIATPITISTYPYGPGISTGVLTNPVIGDGGSAYVNSPSSNTTVVTQPTIVQNPGQLFSYAAPALSGITITGTVADGTYTLSGQTSVGVLLIPIISVTVAAGVATAVTVVDAGSALYQDSPEVCTWSSGSNAINVSLTSSIVTNLLPNGFWSITISGGLFTCTTGTPNVAANWGGGAYGNIHDISSSLVGVVTSNVLTSYTPGVAATAIGESFPGGTGAVLPTTVFNNVSVIPGQAYPVDIPTGGSVTVRYLS
jgi:hypothetical protein